MELELHERLALGIIIAILLACTILAEFCCWAVDRIEDRHYGQLRRRREGELFGDIESYLARQRT